MQPTRVAAPGPKVAADDRVLQAQLEGRVSTLQQTLAKMQETIAAQDAEIADLNRKIAARAEQQRAERATSALAARIAPEVASASDDGAQETGARPSNSEAVSATSAGGAEESGSGSGRVRTIVAASAADDTTVPKRAPRWWAKRATYYWGGALAVAILAAVIATVIRRRREAEVQYAPRYPLVEESPFRYRATLEPQPSAKPAAPQAETSGVHVEEESSESGLESWSTQTALLSELPEPDDTQPFMMAPHDDVETEFENKRKSYAPGTQDPTAKLRAMETQTMDLQTTGELMTSEELAEAELLGVEAPSGPAYDRQERTAVNKEVAEILEASLSYEPDRVDIKLKLLEIYHHEALGNRNNFRSLLSKLAKDSRLSPDQRQHLETLQRTLNEGKQDADSTFVAEVAI